MKIFNDTALAQTWTSYCQPEAVEFRKKKVVIPLFPDRTRKGVFFVVLHREAMSSYSCEDRHILSSPRGPLAGLLQNFSFTLRTYTNNLN